jgi:predicted NAD/FAD-binding protein
LRLSAADRRADLRAWRLAGHHQVTLFEAGATPGGHTATVDVTTPQGTYAIDTGFIVYNDRTYPRFMGLLSELGISAKNADELFGAQPQTGLEYNGHTLTSLFAQRRNLVNPAFWRLLGEIVRFNRLAKQALDGEVDPNATLQTFLEQHGFTPFFARHYILPMGAAIWSSSLQEMKRFPLPLFLRFLKSRSAGYHPSPAVVRGAGRLAGVYPRHAGKAGRPPDVAPQFAGAAGEPPRDGVTLQLENGSHTFDQVIFACHSARRWRCLSPTPAEREVLGDIGWQRNEVFCTAIRAGCRCGSARGPAGTTA